MNTTQQWAFDKALNLAIDWIEAGATSPEKVTRIRRLARIAGADFETMMHIAQDFTAHQEEVTK